MRAWFVGAAMLLGLLGPAGTGAAECVESPVGLFKVDYASVCVLEYNEVHLTNVYLYRVNDVYHAYYIGGNDGGWLGAGSGLWQYHVTDCRPWPCTESGGLQGSTWATESYGPAPLRADVAVAQAWGPGASGPRTSTLGASLALGEAPAGATYRQDADGSGCVEQAAAWSPAGPVSLVGSRACVAEVPQVPFLTLPRL